LNQLAACRCGELPLWAKFGASRLRAEEADRENGLNAQSALVGLALEGKKGWIPKKKRTTQNGEMAWC